MKKILLFTLAFLININILFGNHKANFSEQEIKKLAPAYLESNLPFSNPAFIDIDKDGDFDALKFYDGSVEYYKNTGSLEVPVFVLENKHYDSYKMSFFIKEVISKPIFFADMDGDGDMDLFVVKDKEFNTERQRTDYKVAAAENFLGLDNGTLITIILVLVIIVLVLAIL